MKSFALAAALMASAIFPALADEPIVGKWRAPGGGIVQVSPCGEAFCAMVISGENSGKKAGRMSGAKGDYTGTVTDPRDDRTYEGTASVDGGILKLTGCALKVFCKTQTWTRV